MHTLGPAAARRVPPILKQSLPPFGAPSTLASLNGQQTNEIDALFLHVLPRGLCLCF